MDFFHPLHQVIISITSTSLSDETQLTNNGACAQDQHVTGLIEEYKNNHPAIVWSGIVRGDCCLM